MAVRRFGVGFVMFGGSLVVSGGSMAGSWVWGEGLSAGGLVLTVVTIGLIALA